MKSQISFVEIGHDLNDLKYQITYGGSLVSGKRKIRRPLDKKRPVHLVLKATNSYTLLRNKCLVDKIIHQFNKKFGIKLYSKAIHCDHIHLHLSFQSRKIYVMWIRALTGSLVVKIKKLKFKFLPFTRIIKGWKKDFTSVQRYIEKNRLEGDFLYRIHLYIDNRQIELLKNLRAAGFIKFGPQY